MELILQKNLRLHIKKRDQETQTEKYYDNAIIISNQQDNWDFASKMSENKTANYDKESHVEILSAYETT